ncbi:MAG: hypothetical protein ACXW1D_08765 [Halobacteriota archaeon]
MKEHDLAIDVTSLAKRFGASSPLMVYPLASLKMKCLGFSARAA